MQETICDVCWDGPFEWDKRSLLRNSAHVLYAIYETHPVYGQNVLLYMTLRDFLIEAHRTRIINFAAKSRLPAMYEQRVYVDAGGLMSYGPSLPDSFRRAATYVDKILKRRQAGGPAGGAAHEIRAGHQSQDRRGARAHDSPTYPFPGGRGDPIGVRRGTERGRGTGIREHNHGVSAEVWGRSGLTTACRRRLTASAALPLPAAPEARRWAA